MLHHVYLIPGFFGFADIGGITYFHHVREYMSTRLLDHGIEAQFHSVQTSPTASIRKRAGRLLETIADTAGSNGGPIHLVGHSTGGLDARLFMSPGASVVTDRDFELEAYASRVKSVTTVATPHYGTPMATYFNSMLGSQLLYLLSLGTIYTLRFGKLPLSLLVAVGGIVTKLDDKIGFENTIVDQWYDQLLGDFDLDREAAVKAFLNEIRNDTSLVGQLTPGGIDLFNATTADRAGVPYGCVVTWATKADLGTLRAIGLDPYRQASHAVYRALALLTRGGKFPALNAEQIQFFRKNFGELPDTRSTDGVVPTLSQLWGTPIHAARADHLDACGHFDQTDHDPPHVDWLATGSGFDRDAFEALWGDVVDFIAASVVSPADVPVPPSA